MKTVISTSKLYKTFGEGELAVHAVNDVNLEINEGEFTALVGPSGSVKPPC